MPTDRPTTPEELAALPAKELERLALNINPGGWAVEKLRPIATLLGSCVSVCLCDPKLKIGGMNHFLLPSRGGNSADDHDVILAGDYSMEVMVNALLGKGARKERLVAKAFGGGTIVTSIGMAIGQRNADFAKEWLEREGIPLVAADLLGAWSRKVVFLPGNGDAFCRRMPVTQAQAIQAVQEEKDYEQSLAKPAGKRVELF
jgi:chemotaxis protein CheD